MCDPGNLYATFVYRPNSAPAQAALRSFVAANALFSALSEFVESKRLAVKWPNDVLLDGGKVAGILLESESGQDHVKWLAVGIGVNLATAPEGVTDAAHPPVSVGIDTPPVSFLNVLADHFAKEEDIFTRYGFPMVRDRWMAHAARKGQSIRARTTTETYTGIFQSVDDNGNLELSSSNGTKKIAAAEIFF